MCQNKSARIEYGWPTKGCPFSPGEKYVELVLANMSQSGCPEGWSSYSTNIGKVGKICSHCYLYRPIENPSAILEFPEMLGQMWNVLRTLNRAGLLDYCSDKEFCAFLKMVHSYLAQTSMDGSSALQLQVLIGICDLSDSAQCAFFPPRDGDSVSPLSFITVGIASCKDFPFQPLFKIKLEQDGTILGKLI